MCVRASACVHELACVIESQYFSSSFSPHFILTLDFSSIRRLAEWGSPLSAPSCPSVP